MRSSGRPQARLNDLFCLLISGSWSRETDLNIYAKRPPRSRSAHRGEPLANHSCREPRKGFKRESIQQSWVAATAGWRRVRPRRRYIWSGGGLLMMRAADALKYAAAVAAQRISVALDGICGSDICDGHEEEVGEIWSAVNDIRSLAAEFGDANRYSDGRSVVTQAEICFGYYAEHIWQPDPAAASPSSWRGRLPSDPDVPSPGIYEVATDPTTQQIHVRVVRFTVIENHDRLDMDDVGEVVGDE